MLESCLEFQATEVEFEDSKLGLHGFEVEARDFNASFLSWSHGIWVWCRYRDAPEWNLWMRRCCLFEGLVSKIGKSVAQRCQRGTIIDYRLHWTLGISLLFEANLGTFLLSPSTQLMVISLSTFCASLEVFRSLCIWACCLSSMQQELCSLIEFLTQSI